MNIFVEMFNEKFEVMENGNQPINPILRQDLSMSVHLDGIGLTKREYFAGLAMQGLLSNVSIIDSLTNISMRYIAEWSVIQADELLKQLDK